MNLQAPWDGCMLWGEEEKRETKLRSQPKYSGSELSSQKTADQVFNPLPKDSWDPQTTSKGSQQVVMRATKP